MRVRTFVFALVCGTATAALAQDGGYVRFPSTSPEACALACAGDQMCASWSYGNAARSYGQSRAPQTGVQGGMCTFSGSSVVRNAPGMVSGLPRRDSVGPPVPMMSAPPSQSSQGYQSNQSYAPQASYQNGNQGRTNSGGASGWDVRPAPWLAGSGADTRNEQPTNQQRGPDHRGMPQVLRPVPPIPSPTPGPIGGPRIDYEPQASQPIPQYSRPPQYPSQTQSAPAPQQPAYVPPPTPAYVPPPVRMAPPPQPPIQQAPLPQRRPMDAPPPPPQTQDLGSGGQSMPTIAPPRRVSGARGVPKARQSRQPEVASGVPAVIAVPVVAAIESPSVNAGSNSVSVPLPTRAPAAATARRTAPARGAPRAAAAVPTPANTPTNAGSTGGAPPRQETAARPTPGRGTPRGPVRDPSNPESFRGADGMIDAAEMRRAQLNAAREQGTPAYSVQREWEAVETERQRAAAAGEVRVDPLAGTSPVAPPPETRAQKRAREAEEAAATAEEARANGPSNAEEEAAPQPRSTRRGARGVPRPKAPRQTSETPSGQQVAEEIPRTRARPQRLAPAQALDREPRLSGGPG